MLTYVLSVTVFIEAESDDEAKELARLQCGEVFDVEVDDILDESNRSVRETLKP